MDHVYVNDLAGIKDVHFVEPVFGDYVLLITELHSKFDSSNNSKTTRNWKGYTNVKMNELMSYSLINSGIVWTDLNVQEHWNALENCIINVVDYLVPLEYSDPVFNVTQNTTPKAIKNLINVRKRLLHNDRQRNSSFNAPRIKLLSKEIRFYFTNKKKNRVRRAAVGGNINLWKAVKIAKNLTAGDIPSNLTLGGIPIADGRAADSFAKHFHEKVKLNVAKTKVVVNNVYNGKCKLIVQNRNFMTEKDVTECLNDLNIKKM